MSVFDGVDSDESEADRRDWGQHMMDVGREFDADDLYERESW